MVDRKKQTLLIVSGVLILAIALGVSAVFAQVESQPAGQIEGQPVAQPVLQDDDNDQDEPEAGDPEDEDKAWQHAPFAGRPGFDGGFSGRGGFGGHGGFGERGFGGQFEGMTSMNELLAESLGVTVEQLDEAHTQIFEALVEESDGDFRGRRGFAGSDEMDVLLAEALSKVSGQDISVEDLQAAHEAVREAILEQLPEGFGPSEEQLALMEAHQALSENIDREALFLEAAATLGIEESDLEEARENPQSLFALLEEKGVTMQDFMDAQQAAYEAAVQNAVPEFITQDQANLILEGGFGRHGFGSMRGGHGGGGMRGGMGGYGGGGMHGGGFDCPGGFGPANGNAPTSGASL